MIHCKEKLSYYTEKAQRIVLKRLVKQRKGKVSKNREDIKRKWDYESFPVVVRKSCLLVF